MQKHLENTVVQHYAGSLSYGTNLPTSDVDIRGGSWGYEELVDYAETKDKLIREELYKNTSLPKTPNIKLASKVLMEAQDMCWNT